MIREGLRALLEQETGFEVVGEAAGGLDAVRLCISLTPQVVVMDVSMPDLDGIEACRQVCREAPGVSVLALSMHDDARYVERMLAAGAAGYLLKDCAFDDLVTAIRGVAAGAPSA
jgi:two-component system, NarL family, response regulator NreC